MSEKGRKNNKSRVKNCSIRTAKYFIGCHKLNSRSEERNTFTHGGI
jgi:hypothetical protein